MNPVLFSLPSSLHQVNFNISQPNTNPMLHKQQQHNVFSWWLYCLDDTYFIHPLFTPLQKIWHGDSWTFHIISYHKSPAVFRQNPHQIPWRFYVIYPGCICLPCSNFTWILPIASHGISMAFAKKMMGFPPYSVSFSNQTKLPSKRHEKNPVTLFTGWTLNTWILDSLCWILARMSMTMGQYVECTVDCNALTMCLCSSFLFSLPWELTPHNKLS